MARRKVRNDDYEALGMWLLSHWENAAAGQANDTAVDTLADMLELRSTDQLKLVEDNDTALHVVVPKCPWSAEELQSMKADKDSAGVRNYLKTLAIGIVAGCREPIPATAYPKLLPLVSVGDDTERVRKFA